MIPAMRQMMMKPSRGIPIEKACAIYKMDEPNLLKYSEDFSNAVWVKATGVTVENVGNGVCRVNGLDGVKEDKIGQQVIQGNISGKTYTGAILVKGEGENIGKEIGFWVKRNTGTMGNAAIQVILTGEWQLISQAYVGLADNVDVKIAITYSLAATNQASSCLLWYPQVNLGSSPLPYNKTTDLQQITSDHVPYYWTYESGAWVKRRRRGVNLLLPNQASGGEDGNTVGFAVYGTGVTITVDATHPSDGTKCIKSVADGSAIQQGIKLSDYKSILAGQTKVFSAYLSGSSPNPVVMQIRGRDINGTLTADVVVSSNITLTDTPTRYELAFTASAGTTQCEFAVRTTGVSGVACTLYIDSLQLELGATASDWELPPLNGYNGSALTANTNSGTFNGQGLLLGSDDYATTPAMPPLKGRDTVFTLASDINAASGAKCLFTQKTGSGVFLGSLTGLLTNEIITLSIPNADDGGDEFRAAWCDAVASISAGTHLAQWNRLPSGTWELVLDGEEKILTIVGTARDIPAGAGKQGTNGTYYFNTGSIDHDVPHPETRTHKELLDTRRKLKAEILSRGGTPLW